MRLIIAGFGTVGQGFAEALSKRADMLSSSYGGVKIVAAFDSKSYAADKNGLDPIALVKRKTDTGSVGADKMKDGIDVLNSVEYDILVEASPTNIQTGGDGLRYIEHALRHGKDVITVNKGPLALKFKELKKLADRKKAMIRFEGTVGGAMPIINLCCEDLKGEKVRSIRGIFNGTCNFILGRMDNGLPFEQALKEAQYMGYAESDPSYDIEGIDTACKVVILANSVFKRNVRFSDVSITGIASVNAEAIALAADQDMVIRLIGEVSDTVLEVSPRLIPKGHPLSISGTLNTAQIIADMAGPITISGKGAGRIETASAILSDLIAVMEKRR
ncbi:MAG: homoserine dehydrogenase [Methanomassiliicoccaceae archaeon]|nr:homoserine dehydrogenase [Methanomassiliicoccaceae archaeon]